MHECSSIASSLFLVNINNIIVLHFQLENNQVISQTSCDFKKYNLFWCCIITHSIPIKHKSQISNWHTLQKDRFQPE